MRQGFLVDETNDPAFHYSRYNRFVEPRQFSMGKVRPGEVTFVIHAPGHTRIQAHG